MDGLFIGHLYSRCEGRSPCASWWAWPSSCEISGCRSIGRTSVIGPPGSAYAQPCAPVGICPKRACRAAQRIATASADFHSTCVVMGPWNFAGGCPASATSSGRVMAHPARMAMAGQRMKLRRSVIGSARARSEWLADGRLVQRHAQLR